MTYLCALPVVAVNVGAVAAAVAWVVADVGAVAVVVINSFALCAL